MHASAAEPWPSGYRVSSCWQCLRTRRKWCTIGPRLLPTSTRFPTICVAHRPAQVQSISFARELRAGH